MSRNSLRSKLTSSEPFPVPADPARARIVPSRKTPSRALTEIDPALDATCCRTYGCPTPTWAGRSSSALVPDTSISEPASEATKPVVAQRLTAPPASTSPRRRPVVSTERLASPAAVSTLFDPNQIACSGRYEPPTTSSLATFVIESWISPPGALMTPSTRMLRALSSVTLPAGSVSIRVLSDSKTFPTRGLVALSVTLAGLRTNAVPANGSCRCENTWSSGVPPGNPAKDGARKKLSTFATICVSGATVTPSRPTMVNLWKPHHWVQPAGPPAGPTGS